MRLVTCAYCGKRSKKRAGARFCSDKCRLLAWQNESNFPPCIYCGVPAESIDHIPPQAYRGAIVEMKLDKQYPFLEVDCCHECNSILGHKALWTVKDRKDYIKKILKLRYAKYINIPVWTDKQLEELDYLLQTTVKTGLLIQRISRERLEY